MFAALNTVEPPILELAIAKFMDQFYADCGATRAMGESARSRIDELRIGWPHVLERLLA